MYVKQSSNKPSYADRKTNENIKAFETEKQIAADIIVTLDSETVNSMPHDEQVCIYDFCRCSCCIIDLRVFSSLFI
jgi:hypothetical protein